VPIKLVRLHSKLAVLEAVDNHVKFTSIMFWHGACFILRGAA